MRLSEIQEGLGNTFDEHDFSSHILVFVIYNEQVEPGVIIGPSKFVENAYEVHLTNKELFSGILHVKDEGVWRTREEATKELFKRKLTGNDSTEGARLQPAWTRSLDEIYKRKDYVRCPDGQRHDWEWNGGSVVELKTNRNIEDYKCANCRLTKTVFSDTGQRVNR